MAKRKTTRRRSYTTAAKSISRRVGSLGGGKISPILQGAAGGIASSLLGRFIPGYGSLVGLGAVGYFTGNSTLLTLTGINLAGMIPLGNVLGTMGSGSANGGGAI